MIYSQLRYYVCCDKCGKTIETNAGNADIAAETAQRLGWQCNNFISSRGSYFARKYVNLCPKCKEEKQ